jgi:putative transposase
MSRKRDAIRRDDQVLHVRNRGVDRGLLFRTADDYFTFLDLIRKGLADLHIEILSYSLMPNHFHIMLWQQVAYAVSVCMKQVCGAFAQIMNKIHGRSGHLFQDRYKADPVDDPASILRLSYYIHQNPVRAKLVEKPELWKFSSMREYAGLVKPAMASMDRINRLVGGPENYLKFMKEYDPSAPHSAWAYLI